MLGRNVGGIPLAWRSSSRSLSAIHDGGWHSSRNIAQGSGASRALQLHHVCRKGQFEAAQTELFADDAVSIEPDGSPMEMAEGLAAIQEKGRQFMASVEEMHRIIISEPVVAGNFFTVSMVLDTTFEGRGRVNMEELCVYEVDDGLIVSEQFFYSVG